MAAGQQIVDHLVARGRLDDLAAFELARVLERAAGGEADPRLSLLEHADMPTALLIEAQIALDGGDDWTCPDYQLQACIGAGCAGTVFRALTRDGQTSAIKLMHDYHLRDVEMVPRLVREVELAQELAHPSLPAYRALGWARSGVPFVEMELVAGRSTEGVRFQEAQAWWVLEQLGDLLVYLAERGVVHRDIKPSNLLVSERGVILCDLGLARAIHSQAITVDGEVVGTPRFMSPEQVRGELMTTASDVYSLGATLYQLVLGVPAFDGESAAAVMRTHLSVLPVDPRVRDPSISPALAGLLMRMLAKKPGARPEPAELVGVARSSGTRTPQQASVEGDQ